MTLNKKAPPHPAYQAAFEASVKAGFDNANGDYIRNRVIYDQTHLLNPPLPETLMEEKQVEFNGRPVKLIFVRPVGTENDTLPALIFLHGGGWVLGGGFKTSEKLIKQLVVRAHIAVMYVDYSLSPEVKFPVAVEECYESVVWLHAHASEMRVSKLAIAGDSAGGNFAAAVTIMLGDRGHADYLKGQILIYPVVAYEHDTASFQTYGDGDYFIKRADCVFFYKAYCDGNPPKDVRLAPLLATQDQLKRVPPALVLAAECDLLCDEVEAYARQLTAAGVDTCCVRSIGAMHGYATSPPDTPQYIRSLGMMVDFLTNDVFGK